MSKIDKNLKYASLGYDGANVQPLKVDPVTGRLLIDITAVADSVSVLNASKIDENDNYDSLAYSGTNIRPLLIDNRNGYLYIDLLQE